MSGARRRSLAALALACAAGGCASSGIERPMLPDAPIALLYRTPEQGRQRAEILERARERPGPTRRGVADLGAILPGPDLGDLRDLAGRLVLFDAVSGEISPLDAAPLGSTPLAWSPDGARLLYVSARYGSAQLHEIDLRSGHARALTRGPALHPSGCYLDARTLVYTEARRSGDRVESRLLARSPGGAARALTSGPLDRNPACAPDRSAVVYMAAGPGGRDVLMRVPAAGGEPRRLGPGRHPAYTPDGRWVVYSARRGERFELRRMRPDGSGKTPIGRGVADEFWPSVSPDGRYVVYEASELGRQRLFVRRFDGSAQRILLEEGDAAHPIWNPDAPRRME